MKTLCKNALSALALQNMHCKKTSRKHIEPCCLVNSQV